MLEYLTDEYIEQAERDARRFSGAYTGTSGTLAAHTLRFIKAMEELMDKVAALTGENEGLRAFVESLPPEIAEKYAQFTITRATIPQPIDVKTHRVGVSHDPAALEAAWSGIKRRREDMIQRISSPPVAPLRIIGICGRAGSGKSTVADAIPGAKVLGLADPLYAMLAVMLSIDEQQLRDRDFKESTIPGLGVTVRKLLQTLGTEWGRELVCHDVWIQILGRRIEALRSAGTQIAAVADVRFDNEAEALRAMGAELWLVERSMGDAIDRHVSEAGVSEHLIDRRIKNDGTLDDLRRTVAEALSA